MNNDALTKIHPKFANEKQCKNPKCAGYFLSKVPQDYCPLCREKGFGSGDVEEDGDLVYREVNTIKLQEQVNKIDQRLKLVEERLDKKRKFSPKKCTKCGEKFMPLSPNQKICGACRDKLIK